VIHAAHFDHAPLGSGFQNGNVLFLGGVGGVFIAEGHFFSAADRGCSGGSDFDNKTAMGAAVDRIDFHK
jgi:hypothetical protein